MSSRLLFLDVDGVLWSDRTAYAYNGGPVRSTEPGAPPSTDKLDPIALAAIRQLCKQCFAQIILSSTWRKHWPWAQVRDALNLPIIGITPIDDRKRGNQIADVVRRMCPTAYAIVDDDSFDILTEQKPVFVHVDAREGLLKRDVDSLLSIFTAGNLVKH